MGAFSTFWTETEKHVVVAAAVVVIVVDDDVLVFLLISCPMTFISVTNARGGRNVSFAQKPNTGRTLERKTCAIDLCIRLNDDVTYPTPGEKNRIDGQRNKGRIDASCKKNWKRTKGAR